MYIMKISNFLINALFFLYFEFVLKLLYPESIYSKGSDSSAASFFKQHDRINS